MKKPKEKLDGLGDSIVDDADYYIQDARNTVGNCALWWAVDSKGYTCDLAEAGTYKGSACRSDRDTDVPWPVDVVRAATVTHVRTEPLRRLADAAKQKRRLG